MRIAFVVGEFPSLSVTFINNQITALMDWGHEVDIFPSRPGSTAKVHAAVRRYGLLDRTTYPLSLPRRRLFQVIKGMKCLLAEPFTNLGGRLRMLNIFKHGNPAISLTFMYRVMAFLPRRRYDIIHCHFGPNALAALIARDAGILHGKLVTTFHGYDVNTYPRAHGQGVYKQLFQRGDLYTANSTFTAERAVALGCPTEKIVKLPVGVDLERFAFAERRPDSGGEIRILTVARLVEEKGIEYGIRAVAMLVAAHPNIRHRIAGDGPLLSELRKLAADLGVAGHIDFLGGQTDDEVARCYADAHLFMLPSVVGRDGAEEAQGLVLIEAQATGLPVVATCVGGIPESVLDGESGFLVNERDVDALAAKLGYLIEHPERWAEMGRAGRSFVEQRYDIDKLNEELVRIYQRLLDETATSAA